MYVEAHEELRGHFKVLRMANALGISPIEAIGMLLYLWWWCLAQAPDGDISWASPEEIEHVMEWHGDQGALYKVLLSCGKVPNRGWLDRDGDRITIHDWPLYGGKVIAARRADAARKQAERWQKTLESGGSPEDVQWTSVGRPTVDKSIEDNIELELEKEERNPELRYARRTQEEREVLKKAMAFWATSGMRETMPSPAMQEEMDAMILKLWRLQRLDWWSRVIRYSVDRGKPSWAYVRAVLEGWFAQGEPSDRRYGYGTKKRGGQPFRAPGSAISAEDAAKLRALQGK